MSTDKEISKQIYNSKEGISAKTRTSSMLWRLQLLHTARSKLHWNSSIFLLESNWEVKNFTKKHEKEHDVASQSSLNTQYMHFFPKNFKRTSIVAKGLALKSSTSSRSYTCEHGLFKKKRIFVPFDQKILRERCYWFW